MTAQEIVNEWPEAELIRILFEYGEEKFASRIAANLVKARDKRPRLQPPVQLAEMIKDAIPAAASRTGPHPAKRSFQAIRIAVNDELER